MHIEKLTNAYYLLPNFLELKEAISLFFIIGNRSWKNICYTKVLWKFTTLSWSHKRKLTAMYCRNCLQKKNSLTIKTAIKYDF